MTFRPLLVSAGLHPRNGGPPRVVVEMACQLATQNMAPEIATLCEPGEEAETASCWPELAKSAVPVHYLRRDWPSQMRWGRAVQPFFERNISKFDIVHFHGIWCHAFAVASSCARKTGVPYVVASHGELDRWSLAHSNWKKRLALRFMGVGDMLHRADGIQYGTLDEATEARGLGFAAKEYAVPNGFNPYIVDDISTRACDDLSAMFPALAGSFPIFLFLGRIHPKKGIHLLLEAFARVRAESGNAALLIVGIPQDKEYESRLRARCSSDDLAGRVFMNTDLVGRKALLAANLAHAFVLPSFQEGFSIAILEALALRLPVVATAPCHMSDMQAAGAGFVVDASVAGVVEGLRWVLGKQASELAEIGNRGRAWAEREFHWSSVGTKVANMYFEICDNRAKVRS